MERWGDVAASIGAAGVGCITGVPDSRTASLAALLGTVMPVVWAPREDVAVGFAVGVALGGGHPGILIQTSGFAAALDSVTSLGMEAGLGLTFLIGWCSTPEQAPQHHRLMDRSLPMLLQVLRIPFVVTGPDLRGSAQLSNWIRDRRHSGVHGVLLDIAGAATLQSWDENAS